MNRNAKATGDTRSQQQDHSHDGRSALSLVKAVLSGTGVTAEQITGAFLLVVCVAAAVFV